MRARLYGTVAHPAVAVVGVWDPLVPAHQNLFMRLSRYARRASLTSLAIVLHPHPVILVHGPAEWPVYNDVRTRIALLQASGVEAVLLVRFTPVDLDAGARQFFDLVRPHARLTELWLGARQSLGRSLSGSPQTVARVAKARGMRVKRLSRARPAALGSKARRLLAEGRLAEAIHIVGRPPVWGQPPSGRLRFAWPAGNYLAVPLDAPTAPPAGKPLRVALVARRPGLSTLEWPHRSIPWLAFTAGPAP